MARASAEKRLALSREMGHQHGTANALGVLGRVCVLEGDYAAAQELYEQSVVIACELQEKWVAAVFLVALGEVVAAQQQLAWAAQLWGAAEAIRDATGVPIPLLARAAHEHSVSSARVHLGEKAFTAAWGQGRSMTPKQALPAKGLKPAPPPTGPAAPPPTSPDALRAP